MRTGTNHRNSLAAALLAALASSVILSELTSGNWNQTFQVAINSLLG